MNVNIYRGNLEACRVCLATDIKLISLQNKHLKHMYFEFSGVPMMVPDSLPQHICMYCCALLKKCFKFKQKCNDTNNMLRLYLLEMHALTTSFINTLDRSHLRIPLTITDTVEYHCIPEPDINTEVTVENAMKTKTISILDDDPESINGLDKNSNQDCDDVLENNELMPDNEESKCLEEASEAANTGDDEKQEQKDNLNSADKILTDDEERVEDFKNTYCNKYMHSDKESFYLFILKKYLEKSKSVKYNDLLLLESNLGDNTTETPALISTEYYNIDYSREEVKTNIKLCNSTQNIHQKRFYEFINYRYVNNSDIVYTIRRNNLNSADKILNDNEERVEDFKNTYCNKVMHSDKESFYKFILEKYLEKSESVKYNDLTLLENNSDVNSTEICTDNYYDIKYTKEENKNISEHCDSNQNTNQKRLYKFINDIYVNGDTTTIKQKKIRDINRMRIKKTKSKRDKITKDTLAKISKEFNVDIIKLVLKEEKIQDFQQRKETEKYKKAKYKCELCYTGFAHERTFQNHKAIHDTSAGPYECEVCHVRFKRAHLRNSHILKLHRYNFICRECGRVMKNGSIAREHHRTHSGLKYTCEHCNETFNTYSARANHLRIHHGSVSCDICHMKFTSELGLFGHKAKAHKELYKCAMCLVSFHDGIALRRHKELTVAGCGAHIMPCTQCGESCFHVESLVQHMDGHKWTTRDVPGTERPYRTRRRRKQEPGSSLPQQELMCEICAKTFKYPVMLHYHQSTHSDERPFACEICDKRFKNKLLLKEHVKTHMDERPFQCAHCLKAFRLKGQLVKHMRVHSDERPFPCPICHKRFKARDAMQFHMRTVHEGQPTKKRVRKRKAAGNNTMIY